MYKFGLVGGAGISSYSVAPKLWELIKVFSGENFIFETIELGNLEEVRSFYDGYLQDKSFIGFNVALPWKLEFSKLTNSEETINTVYKKQDSILSCNTDVEGIYKPLSEYINTNKHKVLILGAGGAGLSTAKYLKQKGMIVYVYDIKPRRLEVEGVYQLYSISQIRLNKYSLIINATELGKYYMNSIIKAYSSPLDIDSLIEISTKDSVVQEMNYLPMETMFLQSGKKIGLRTIPGLMMLVIQATRSFYHYSGIDLDEATQNNIYESMKDYIKGVEDAIISKTIC